MIKFENIAYWWIGFAILLIPILFISLNFWRNRRMKRFADKSLWYAVRQNYSKAKRNFKITLLTIIALVLFVLILNLQFGTKMQEVKRVGADVMIVLDISKSMLAEDMQPNRLEKSKQAVERLIDNLDGDRIGLILFAGEAYTQLPITADYAAAKLFLSSVSTDMISKQGTNISDAIKLAVESFGKDAGKNKAIILITDGEDHEEDIESAIALANEKSIMINSIGVGSIDGVPIPEVKNGLMSGYKQDASGNTVVTKLNEQLIQSIAAKSRGVYIRASNSGLGLNEVMKKIDELDKKTFNSKMYSEYEDQFPILAWLALALLMIELLISERTSRLWNKINPLKSK
jgi:Ca-activated chloride channel homolog